MKNILKQLNQKPIAYYPIYKQVTGTTTGGVLLSQLMYWFSKKDKIFKTDNEIMEETLLSKKELENAKKLIKKLDFIEVSREGLPAKTYYKIDWDVMVTSLPQWGKQENPKRGKATPQNGETVVPETGKHSIYTENTTENTTEIKEKEKNKLIVELVESESINPSEESILTGFIDYRKKLKKVIKTVSPLKAFLREIRKINEAGFDLIAAIELMKEKEWQTLKLEYIQNSMQSKTVAPSGTPKASTFYAATKEQKQEDKNKTLADIANMRKLMESGEI